MVNLEKENEGKNKSLLFFALPWYEGVEETLDSRVRKGMINNKTNSRAGKGKTLFFEDKE